MRVATIDIGTNSVLLLIAERSRGALVPVLDRATITRLGQGVDRTRALAPEAIERTLACLAAYARTIRDAEVERVDAVGTSAMRDARGGDEFVRRATALLGVAPRVISGEEEARLTFEGALSGLDLGVAADEPVSVFDIGGGSTEVVVGSRGGRVERAVSLDVGSVRLTERHVRTDPPSSDEIAAVARDVRGALVSMSGVARGRIARWVGVAGTVTTIAALVHDVAPYDGARVHGARVSAADLERILARLSSMTLADRRALPALDPARADVIVAGCVIAQELLRWAGAQELIASDRGVRWGLAQRLANGS